TAEVALATFDDGATLEQPLTSDIGLVRSLVAGLDANGDTRSTAGLTTAIRELQGVRKKTTHRQIVLLVSDGVLKDDPAAEADAARAAGIEIYALILPTNEYQPINRDQILALTGSADHIFTEPDPTEVVTLARGMTRYRPEPGLWESITIVDVIPRNMRYVAGSAVPPAAFDATANTLTWTLGNVLADASITRAPSAQVQASDPPATVTAARWRTQTRTATIFTPAGYQTAGGRGNRNDRRRGPFRPAAPRSSLLVVVIVVVLQFDGVLLVPDLHRELRRDRVLLQAIVRRLEGLRGPVGQVQRLQDDLPVPGLVLDVQPRGILQPHRLAVMVPDMDREDRRLLVVADFKERHMVPDLDHLPAVGRLGMVFVLRPCQPGRRNRQEHDRGHQHRPSELTHLRLLCSQEARACGPLPRFLRETSP
ncbi:MAG: VWA domain-containing protein, partial [Candidatus Brocadiae bacterium]|nr:VWA domain-containing protein [Candidatus Brocadiia bacterium]